MISHDHRCIFVHIPKTGGSSVEDAIWGPDRSTRTTDDLWMGAVAPHRNKYQTGGLQHLLATQIRTEVGGDVFDSYYRFAFVRNPWDKAVSQFVYLKTRPDLLRYMGLRRWVGFEKYLEAIPNQPHVQAYEQWRFLLDDDGELLVDFVGRFERLSDDFAVVRDQLGIEADLPHAMRSAKRKPTSAYYTPRTVDMVAELYARDIEMFDYRFEG